MLKKRAPISPIYKEIDLTRNIVKIVHFHLHNRYWTPNIANTTIKDAKILCSPHHWVGRRTLWGNCGKKGGDRCAAFVTVETPDKRQCYDHFMICFVSTSVCPGSHRAELSKSHLGKAFSWCLVNHYNCISMPTRSVTHCECNFKDE